MSEDEIWGQKGGMRRPQMTPSGGGADCGRKVNDRQKKREEENPYPRHKNKALDCLETPKAGPWGQRCTSEILVLGTEV